jgi:hypothetical protein
MIKTSAFILVLFFAFPLFSQTNYTAKNEIGGINYQINYSKHIVNNKKIWGEYFSFNQKIELGEFILSGSVKIPFTDILLEGKSYTFSVLPKEHGEWTIFFKEENSKEISYNIAPFTLFNTNSNTLLFYIEEPEPSNGMAFIRLVGNETQIGFYLEPVK